MDTTLPWKGNQIAPVHVETGAMDSNVHDQLFTVPHITTGRHLHSP